MIIPKADFRELSMHYFSDNEYSRILDNIVIVCVDTLVVDENNNFLLGKRTKYPIKDWWIFGGRMFAKESYIDAARRGLKRELGITMQHDPNVIGFYNLLWDMRDEEPQTNGCNVLLVAMLYKYNRAEGIVLGSSDDHSEVKWFSKDSSKLQELHPYLKTILKDANLI